MMDIPTWLIEQAERISQYMDQHCPGHWEICGIQKRASNPVAEEAQAEQFIQAAIDRAPEPLRRLGEYLSHVLDEDQWSTVERMLLGACNAAPQASETYKTCYKGE